MNLARSQPRMVLRPEPTSTDPGGVVSQLRDTPKRDARQAARPQSPITWHINGATLATFDAFIIGIPIRSGNFLGQRIRRRYSGTAPTAMGHRCVRRQVSMLTFSCAPWDHQYPHPPCTLLRIILIFFSSSLYSRCAVDSGTCIRPVDLSQIPNVSFIFCNQTFTDRFSVAGTTL
ncbi:hypothetical protein B0H14DRAFT_2723412, partial [Mycena olivaceomarginata]